MLSNDAILTLIKRLQNNQDRNERYDAARALAKQKMLPIKVILDLTFLMKKDKEGVAKASRALEFNFLS
ncbi:Neverland protein [Mycoavidus cysteinexigens]|uniref:Neverland protein n=1 Tax=Mycoavidus cysteinexigens TaxID=1553431 RepID=A0A2Z6EUE3_9BURK|nr:Neverland protein [Mycoavidus cysteinexigens]GLR00292.1 hypothetical protein GCM10007934_01030 [Mycoavidus cysteinexigens]